MSTDLPFDIFLLPGDYFVGDARYRVRTLLGSCVSITLWHPGLRIGAMSHFQLPGERPHRQGCAAGKPGLYGADAMRLMMEDLARRDVPLAQCEGKIFGGGAMFPRTDRVADIGARNGDYARSMLQQHGIPLVSESLFGEGYRQLIFTIANGDVLSRLVPPEPRFGNSAARTQA
jgi:chemotaxis protein CheD